MLPHPLAARSLEARRAETLPRSRARRRARHNLDASLDVFWVGKALPRRAARIAGQGARGYRRSRRCTLGLAGWRRRG
eukprot:1401775-Pleurochrysis_carterae.AAC.1